MLADEERETALVTVKVEENGLCKLCWLLRAAHAESAEREREWVLVNVRDVEVD